MRSRPSVTVAASLLLLAVAAAQTPLAPPSATAPSPTATPVAPITLEQCVALALDKNFDLRVQRFSTANAKDSLVIAKSGFDPDLSVRTTKRISGSPGNRTDSIDTTVEVSQPFVTGTTVTAGTGFGQDKDRPPPSNDSLNPIYGSDFGVSVSQPLLRGFGTAYNRSSIDRARIGIARANYDFKGAVLDVIRRVEAAYYNLAFSREQLGVRRFSLEIAQKLLDENQAKKNTGVATDLDVLQAEVGLANARRSLLLAEQAVRDREDILLSLINPFQFNTQLGPISLADDPVLTVSFEHSYKQARDNDPDFASMVASIRQLEIDERVARRNKLPSLSATGGVGYDAVGRSYGRAAGEAWDRDRYDYTLGLSFSMPWGLRAERARHRQAMSAVSQMQARLEQLDQAIVVDVRSAVRAVQTNQESVKISGLATQLSQRQYELEKARYDAGLSTFRRVQESQEQLDAARVSELQAKVNLRNALAELARLEASSLARYNVKLEQ